MKLRNIILCIQMAGIFCSCVSEEMLEGPVFTNEEATVNVIISSENVKTRAIDGDGNYQYARPEELVVTKCFVALFDADGNRMGYKEASGMDLTTTTVHGGSAATDTLAYQVNGIKLEGGNVAEKIKDLTIVAIANSKRTDLASFDTYAKLSAATVVEVTDFTALAFDARTLVKAGEIRNYQLDLKNKTDIVIPMTQLAARIDLKFVVNAPEGSNSTTTTTGSWKYTGSEIAGKDKAEMEGLFGTSLTLDEIWGQGWANVLPSTEACVFKIPNSYQKTITTTRLTYLISEVTVKNVETVTRIMLTGTDINPQSVLLRPMEKRAATVDAEGNYTFSFYTYEKNVNATSPLQVSLTGELVKMEETDVYTTERTDYAYYYLTAGSNSIIANWKGMYSTFAYNNQGTEKTTLVDSQKNIGTPTTKSYGFDIIPTTAVGSNTNGVIHGNLYQITAKIKVEDDTEPSVDIEAELTYDVIPWVSKIKDLPVFE